MRPPLQRYSTQRKRRFLRHLRQTPTRAPDPAVEESSSAPMARRRSAACTECERRRPHVTTTGHAVPLREIPSPFSPNTFDTMSGPSELVGTMPLAPPRFNAKERLSMTRLSMTLLRCVRPAPEWELALKRGGVRLLSSANAMQLGAHATRGAAAPVSDPPNIGHRYWVNLGSRRMPLRSTPRITHSARGGSPLTPCPPRRDASPTT